MTKQDKPISVEQLKKLREKGVINVKGHLAVSEQDFNTITDHVDNYLVADDSKVSKTTKVRQKRDNKAVAISINHHKKRFGDNWFVINIKLPSLNEYINIERTNKYGAAKIKKQWTDICAYFCSDLQKTINPDALYDLEITWIVGDNKSDSDNIFFAKKFILDGLVEAKVLNNDNRKHIRHIKDEIYTDKETGFSTVVKLIEI